MEKENAFKTVHRGIERIHRARRRSKTKCVVCRVFEEIKNNPKRFEAPSDFSYHDAFRFDFCFCSSAVTLTIYAFVSSLRLSWHTRRMAPHLDNLRYYPDLLFVSRGYIFTKSRRVCISCVCLCRIPDLRLLFWLMASIVADLHNYSCILFDRPRDR